MMIKYGTPEQISVIEPVDVSDESTKEKLESLKEAVISQESKEFILSHIDQESK